LVKLKKKLFTNDDIVFVNITMLDGRNYDVAVWGRGWGLGYHSKPLNHTYHTEAKNLF